MKRSNNGLEDKLQSLYKQSLRRYRKNLTALNRISLSLGESKDLKETLDKALENVLHILKLSSGVMYLLDENGKSFTLATYKRFSIRFAKTLNIIFENGKALADIIKANRPVTITDIKEDEILAIDQQSAPPENIKCLENIVLKTGNKKIGVICVASPDPISLSPEDVVFLETLGGQVGTMIYYARLLQKINGQSITDDLTGLFNRRHFSRVLETETYRSKRHGWPVSLVMLDIDNLKGFNDQFGHIAGNDLLKSLATTINLHSRKTDLSFRLGGDEFAIILPDTDSNKASKIIDRIRLKWDLLCREYNLAGEVTLGFSSGIGEFPKNAETQDSLIFLADAALYYSKKSGRHQNTLVSDLKSMTIKDKLTKAMVDQVFALSITVETKEAFGFGHFKRVAGVAEMICKEMGLSKSEIEDIKEASLLHDIGKVGIPDEILTKHDKLTAAEWEVIKKHTTEGAKIIGQIGKIAHLAFLVLHHHERYDGMGYPDKLKGDQIPLGARIISIADAYDSMVTPRPYRSIATHEAAIEELERFAGTQFDPDVVKIAVAVLSAIVGS